MWSLRGFSGHGLGNASDAAIHSKKRRNKIVVARRLKADEAISMHKIASPAHVITPKISIFKAASPQLSRDFDLLPLR